MTYNEFIQNIIDTRGQWNIPDNEYWEGHHIIPRCLGGEGYTYQKHPNIIRLYAKEHYIAHKLLFQKNPDNKSLACAFSMMAFPKGKTSRQSMLSADEYQEARKLFSESIQGENNPMYNKSPWNKGLTKETDQRVAQYSQNISTSKNGVSIGPNSEQGRINKSLAVRKRFQEHPETFTGRKPGQIPIVNDITSDCYYIDIDDTIPQSYRKGLPKHKHHNIKDINKYKQQKHEQCVGINNPMYGKGYKVAGVNNPMYGKKHSEESKKKNSESKYQYLYGYENKLFKGVYSLQKYLNYSNYPDISQTAIEACIRGGSDNKLSVKYRYPELNLAIFKITKEEYNENQERYKDFIVV